MSMQSLQQENERLRQRIAELEAQLEAQHTVKIENPFEKAQRLTNPEILRFGRQLILPEIGPKGQLKLRNSSVLVVGAGGLGAPAILYLAAGGIGRVGVVDHDTVDISNLHRQVIHRESTRGVNKAISAAKTAKEINSGCHIVPYDMVMDSTNALELIQQYDIIVDATDNVATRYLLNDACVLSGKPLVSGSALRLDGQLAVYNYNGGPCYRCLHPVPPPPETVTNCADGGVLGVVPGVIGILQALETIKIIIGMNEHEPPSFLIFSGFHTPMFRSMRLRAKKKDCVVCGENPSIKALIDYVEFCGAGATDKELSLSILSPAERISVQTYRDVVEKSRQHVLLDVRSAIQQEICKLPNSLCIPLTELDGRIKEVKSEMDNKGVQAQDGNDSQLAVRTLAKHGIDGARDIAGGLYKWAQEVDTTFPIY